MRRPKPLTGTIDVPGDKSISHRALLLAALAPGASTIRGLNDGDDVRRTSAAVSALGATVAAAERSSLVQVEGWGERGPQEPATILDAGNSGTTARLLLGVVAHLDGTAVIAGDESLSARPMLRVVAPLRSMGATIDGRDHGDHLPLTVRGGRLEGMDHSLTVSSAQVKSALLLAGLRALGSTSVREPSRSRDHTETMLRAAGVQLEIDELTVRVEGGQSPTPMQWEVPGDVSSAMYLIVAATLVAGSDLTIRDVGLNPTRTGAIGVLQEMGADIVTSERVTTSGEVAGDVRVRSSDLIGCRVGAGSIPTLIDEIPILAVAASQADGETVFEGVSELRAKESDRLTAIATGLGGLGVATEVSGDDLAIRGPARLQGGVADSRGDHRMAMSFAIAGLISESNIRVDGWSCVQTSFPTFLDVLGSAQGGGK